MDVSINQSSVFLSPLALRQGPFALSGFHRLSSLLWALPTPIRSSPRSVIAFHSSFAWRSDDEHENEDDFSTSEFRINKYNWVLKQITSPAYSAEAIRPG